MCIRDRHSSSCYWLLCLLGLHRFHRLWGLGCCLLSSLLCHVDQDWEIETVGNLRVFKDKLPWTRWTKMSPYYASQGSASGRHNRRLPQGIMRNRFHFSPRKQILCNLSYYRFWCDIYPILEITNNPKALTRIGPDTARDQRKAFRFGIVGHLRCYVCLCSALIVLLRFRVQCFNYLV